MRARICRASLLVVAFAVAIGGSGHGVLHCKCPLLTQSGHHERTETCRFLGLNGQMADHSNQTHPLDPEDRGRHQPEQ